MKALKIMDYLTKALSRWNNDQTESEWICEKEFRNQHQTHTHPTWTQDRWVGL